MAPKIERVLDGDNIILGEGPHWDAETQSLYFVDYFGQNINKYVPSTKKHTRANIGKKVSLIIPVKGKNEYFLIVMERELLLITWDGVSDTISIVKKIYEAEEKTTFNDGKSDSSGRLWAGTMGVAEKEGDFVDEKGSLFSLQNNKITTQLYKIEISNGLAFDTNSKKFYYNDFFKGTLDQFDLDVGEGTIYYFCCLRRSEFRRVSFTQEGTGLTPPENGALYKVTGLNTKRLPGDRIAL